jgi:predicted  nucleic acid-binding Zn-ribbon protein
LVTADPAVQQRLLDVQAVDTVLAQLAHRRRGLPQIAELAHYAEEAAALHSQAVGLQTQLSDIAGEQRRLENDIEVVRQRERRNQQRLDTGGIPAKELENLQHELQSLARRQASLEDETLEVMEQREEIERALAAVQQTQAELAERQHAAMALKDAATAEIDEAIAERTVLRTRAVDGMPADLLNLYDKVRQAQGGIGAAGLRQRRCDGCRLELAGSELSAVRRAAPDEVLRCENCRRILVRTAESGL